MSYGHANSLAGGGNEPGGKRPARAFKPGKADPLGALPSDWYSSPDLAAALAGHDFATVYRWLKDAGVPQRLIATVTGTTQPQVADIAAGRQVSMYEVLVRIAEGLSIPRERMGLSFWGPDGKWYGPGSPGAYAGKVTVTDPEEVAEMLRRQFEHLLALGAATVFSGPVPGVGTLAPDLPVPAAPRDLPTRLGKADVAVIRGYREQLSALARQFGGQARAAVALADWADRWLTVDATDAARCALLGELANLHTIVGWCCHDGDAPGRALHHLGRAVTLAGAAGDAFQASYALRWTGTMLVNCDRPNDGLKTLQLANVRLLDVPRDDPRVPVLQSWCHAEAALALARLDGSAPVRGQARRELATARDGWAPQDTHAEAKMNLVSAMTWMSCGQLDAAEKAAALSARTFGAYRRDGLAADLVKAQLHVMSGDSGALRLAELAVNATEQTRSGVARQVFLPPLIEALESRRGSDYADLARSARQVATTRV